MLTDKDYMRRCLELARLGEYYVAPNPMVGAVLVDEDGRIIGEGWHRQFGGPHAEVNCFRDADKDPHPTLSLRNDHSGRSSILKGEESGTKKTYPGCTLYVSLEPCSHYGKTPPCANLVVEKGVKKVVIGCLDPNPKVAGRGVKILQDAGIEVVSGVLEDECRWLNRRFMTLQEKHRPYVILKWAQTADGYLDKDPQAPLKGDVNMGQVTSEKFKVQSSKREPLQISNTFTKRLVHKLRAENMAILVGSGTALADDPHLTNKHWTGRNPVRVLLDRRGRVPADARIFGGKAESDYAGNPSTIVYRENTDWKYVLEDLASRNIHSLIIEGGAQVLGTIIAEGIWDEIHIETAPITIGEGVKAPEVSGSKFQVPSSKLQNKIVKSITEIYEKDHILTIYFADNGFVCSE